jgi:tRNA-binding protein
MKPLIHWDDFDKIDMRVGTITHAELNEKAKKPAYILHVDFGSEIGIKKSSAQITTQYKPKDIIGAQVIAVINFPVKQIASMMSECLILGAVDGADVTLLSTLDHTPNGLKIN